MKKLVALVPLALALASTAALAETYTGVVADAMCAKDPVAASKPDHAACAKKCIKGGEPTVLVVGDKVYKVANADKLAPFIGDKVTVNGKLAGDTLTVASASPLASTK